MNICTYVTAISMKPKQYAVALDCNTETFDRISHSNHAVLQILSQQHINLVRPLGKKSGHSIDKHNWLSQRDLLTSWKGHLVLKDVCALVSLKKTGQINTHGDHELVLFEATGYTTKSEEGVLMFQDLINQNIIL